VLSELSRNKVVAKVLAKAKVTDWKGKAVDLSEFTRTADDAADDAAAEDAAAEDAAAEDAAAEKPAKKAPAKKAAAKFLFASASGPAQGWRFRPIRLSSARLASGELVRSPAVTFNNILI